MDCSAKARCRRGLENKQQTFGAREIVSGIQCIVSNALDEGKRDCTCTSTALDNGITA
jgi:hypothetical protein